MPVVRRTALQIMAGGILFPAVADASSHVEDIDWPRFLSRHDLVWDRLPQAWDEGPFLGNGMLGCMVYYDAAAGALRFDLGRSDVQDHRFPAKTQHDTVRLPMGHFLLKPQGDMRERCDLRLVLHEATLRGEIITDRGRIGLTAYVHAIDMVLVVETEPSLGEAGLVWEWVGEEAISPRQTWGITRNEQARVDPTYQPNPPGVRETDEQEQLWLQPLLVGGGTATAWRIADNRLTASVAHSHPDDTARSQALTDVRRLAAQPAPQGRHMRWWADFYPASFVSLTDTRIESFYWIQLYKLASATRADRAYVDNQGPWLQPTAWPWATLNLNVQLIYWPAIASNHSDLVGSLIGALHENQAQLVANVAPEYRADSATVGRSAGSSLNSPAVPPRPGGGPTLMSGIASEGGRYPETGNLPWLLHDVWLVWRHTMDETLLRDTLFPLLRRATNYYRHFLTRGADGRLHMPATYSPEYAAAPDLNYDLALLRWSCATLIEAAERLDIDDPLLPEWARILDQLVDYPKDETGFLIGAGQRLATSHRHYSHLLMIYPLYLVNIDQAGGAPIIRRSLDHWQSMPERLRGYSSTGAASIAAALGRGDEALRYLHGLFDDYLRPNTFYKESGPVIETPLSGAQSILDMLLQSWGGVIRPFPAMPSAWPDCVFSGLSAEGGFLVAAERERGRTHWITVKSGAGEPFALKTDIADPVGSVDGRPRPLRPDAAGRWCASLARGETILIHPRGAAVRPRIRAIRAQTVNSFGLNPRNVRKRQRDMSLEPLPDTTGGRSQPAGTPL